MSIQQAQRYHLHPSVFYRCYGEKTVVYLTSQQKVFTFGGSVDNILFCFKEYCSIEETLQKLSTLYEIEDQQVFYSTVVDFVYQLADLGIIEPEYQQYEEDASLESEIKSYFSDTNVLYAMTFELTYHCNERCRHCYISQKDLPEMSTTQIKTVIHDLRKMGVFNLIFTGGELFVRKDTFEILEYAYSEGFIIDIFTNGTLLDGDDIIRLKSIWPRSVHFSLYSHRADKHDSITQVKGSFEKTIKAIKSCITIGIPVNIKTPIMTETIDDVRGIANLAKSLRASIELGSEITPKKNGDLQPTKLKITDEYSETVVIDTIKELIPSKTEVTPSQDSKSKLLCGAGQHSLSINPYGEVYPCIMLQLCIGNATQNSIKDIWEQSESLFAWRENNLRANRIGCDGCKFADECVFCPGEALMRTGNPLHKYDEACQSTPRAINRKKQKGGKSDEGNQKDVL